MRRTCITTLAIAFCIACQERAGRTALPVVDTSGFHSEVRDAIEKARRAASEPSSLMAYCKVLHAHEQLKAAAQCYKRAIEFDATQFDSHYLRGQALASNGEYKEAASELEAALRIKPDSAAASVKLNNVRYDLGDSKAAKKDTRVVEDPLMREVEALNAGAVGVIRRAQILESQGRLAETESLLLKAVEMDPKLVQGWVNLISLYGRLGDSAKAEQAYQKAIEINPNRADAHYNFGVLCFKQNKIEAARAAFEKAIEVEPRHAEALHNRAVLFERDGRLNDAARFYERAIEAQPGYAQAHFHLGRIQVNQGRMAEAIANFEKALSPESEATPTYLYALGATHARAGHRNEAVTRLQQAREMAMSRGQTGLIASIDRDLRALGVR